MKIPFGRTECRQNNNNNNNNDLKESGYKDVD
jgi:hypothetical protein